VIPRPKGTAPLLVHECFIVVLHPRTNSIRGEKVLHLIFASLVIVIVANVAAVIVIAAMLVSKKKGPSKGPEPNGLKEIDYERGRLPGFPLSQAALFLRGSPEARC
jgi:heme/copper-type cytochrome/quinol oxidase subunit 2